jgi:hypothetical protein
MRGPGEKNKRPAAARVKEKKDEKKPAIKYCEQ